MTAVAFLGIEPRELESQTRDICSKGREASAPAFQWSRAGPSATPSGWRFNRDAAPAMTPSAQQVAAGSAGHPMARGPGGRPAALAESVSSRMWLWCS